MLGRRILWWCNAFDPPCGGAEIWAQHIVRRLHSEGRDQRVIAVEDGAGTSRTSAFDGVPLTVIHAADRLTDAPALSSTMSAIRDIFAEHRPELVLVNNFGHASLALLGLMRSRIEAPVVLIAHNRWPNEAAVPGSPLDLAVRRARAIVTFEPHIAEWLGARWPSAAIACIDHGIPIDDTPILPLPDVPQLLFCGRLSEEKGPLVLADAMAQLARSHPAVRLLIAGNGHQRADIQARIEALALAQHVRLAGGVAPERVGDLIDQAFAVCIPSLTEGFGLIALEAAWRGRPVVASRVGGLPGIVREGETGLLVPPGDPQALAGALTQLLDDPQRARDMGRKARARAESRPGWDQHVAQFEGAIANVLQRGGERDARAALG